MTPRARLAIDVVDASGRRTPARISVIASDGRAYAPHDAWMHGDDGFDRSRQSQETHYFHCSPPCELELPAGTASVTVQHGFATVPWTSEVRLEAGRAASLRAELARHDLPPEFGRWVSADLHVHMNYGGQYRNTPAAPRASRRQPRT